MPKYDLDPTLTMALDSGAPSGSRSKQKHAAANSLVLITTNDQTAYLPLKAHK